MPKAEPHFDCDALLGHVALQDIGLRVSTNDPAGFRRIVYAAMRARPVLRCRVYQCPRSRNAFLLVKLLVADRVVAEELPEPLADEEAEA